MLAMFVRTPSMKQGQYFYAGTYATFEEAWEYRPSEILEWYLQPWFVGW